tara:strand:+ start:7159 stop:7857 length:699 start_codon:yes stop_codon:yes gene_type:complete
MNLESPPPPPQLVRSGPPPANGEINFEEFMKKVESKQRNPANVDYSNISNEIGYIKFDDDYQIPSSGWGDSPIDFPHDTFVNVDIKRAIRKAVSGINSSLASNSTTTPSRDLIKEESLRAIHFFMNTAGKKNSKKTRKTKRKPKKKTQRKRKRTMKGGKKKNKNKKTKRTKKKRRNVAGQRSPNRALDSCIQRCNQEFSTPSPIPSPPQLKRGGPYVGMPGNPSDLPEPLEF